MSYYITPAEYDLAEQNGISKITLYHRIYNLAWDKRRAITAPPRPTRTQTEFVNLAKANGISYGVFYMRIKRGWTPERAATQPTTEYKPMGRRRTG